jgi:hypothetical protein
MAEGVPSPTGKNPWFMSTVNSILTNEKYKGDALRQKTYTKDFLSKEKIKNQGEMQQYYISEHHEAIISPEIFDRVQAEMKRRGADGDRTSGQYIFSQRIKCADCGAWYGRKTWHPNTNFSKIIWQCNDKYKKKKAKCSTPHFYEDELRALYLSALNKLIDNKNRIIAVFDSVIDKLCGLDGYLVEEKSLKSELRVVTGIIEEANTSSDSAQLDELLKRCEIAQTRLDEVQEEMLRRTMRKSELECFFRKLQAKESIVTEFDNDLWCNLVDYMTVYSKTDVRVTFMDGTEIRC